MAEPLTLATELAARMAPVVGAHTYAFQPERIDPADGAVAVVVRWPEPINFNQTLGNGKTRWTFGVLACAYRMNAEGTQVDIVRAQRTLSPYFADRGPQSLKAAIEDGAAPTVADVYIVSASGTFGLHHIAAVPFIGCVLTVEAWTT